MKDQTIALAGVYQAAALAHELANSGAVSRMDYFNASLSSLFVIDADTTAAVFDNDMSRLTMGLETLGKAFNKDRQYIPVIKYVLTLLSLQAKLQQDSAMVTQVQQGIMSAKRFNQKDQDDFDPQVISQLATTYSKTISTLQPRVIIAGQPFHLKNPDVTEKIRAVLLAGIRSAVLWKQVGGGHLQLLFKRKGYIQEAEQLLKQS